MEGRRPRTCRSVSSGSENYPLFWDRVMIPYFEGDHVVTVRGKQIGR